jgi:uracil-DNA glycosylase
VRRPQNKPTTQEMDNCQPFLEREIEILQPKVIVALGRIAFERILRLYSEPKAGKKFAHGAVFRLEAGPWLVCSYHPSQQNTLTGKLTVEMFDACGRRSKSWSKNHNGSRLKVEKDAKQNIQRAGSP